jgi:tripartite-type tricarboxylate transporter receptor subunit TctC
MMRLVCTIILILAAAPVAADEPYPSRSVTIIVPFPPSGIADLTARPLAPALERVLKRIGKIESK